MDANKNRKNAAPATKPAGVQNLSPTQYEQVRQAVQKMGDAAASR